VVGLCYRVGAELGGGLTGGEGGGNGWRHGWMGGTWGWVGGGKIYLTAWYYRFVACYPRLAAFRKV
jgi:hypothetical protein